MVCGFRWNLYHEFDRTEWAIEVCHEQTLYIAHLGGMWENIGFILKKTTHEAISHSNIHGGDTDHKRKNCAREVKISREEEG